MSGVKYLLFLTASLLALGIQSQAVASAEKDIYRDNSLWRLIKSDFGLHSGRLDDDLRAFGKKSVLILNQKMIASLAGFPGTSNTLTNLDLSFNQIQSLSGLDMGFGNLKILLLASNQLQNLKGFPAAPVLELFSAKNNLLESLEGMPQSLPYLQNLLLDQNLLTDLNSISPELDSLQFLSLKNNKALKDISGLYPSLERRIKLYEDVCLTIDLRGTAVGESAKSRLRKYGVIVRD